MYAGNIINERTIIVNKGVSLPEIYDTVSTGGGGYLFTRGIPQLCP